MIQTPLRRAELTEIGRAMTIVVLHGIDEKRPNISVAGWVEDVPHAAGDEAIVVQEPVSYITSADKLVFIKPMLGIPLSREYFAFTSVDTFEGDSKFGTQYRAALSKWRDSNLDVSITAANEAQLFAPDVKK